MVAGNGTRDGAEDGVGVEDGVKVEVRDGICLVNWCETGPVNEVNARHKVKA